MSNPFVIKDGVLTGYHQKESEIYVPAGVHTIGAGAFKGHASIRLVVLPDSVRRIEKDAFKGCRKLEQVIIPPNLDYVGAYAFHRCHQLQEIDLPLTVTSLSDCTFLYCDHLKSAVIPGVKTLGQQVFLHASKLSHLELSSELSAASLHFIFSGCYAIREVCVTGQRPFYTDNMLEVFQQRGNASELVQAVARDIYRSMVIEQDVLVRFTDNIEHVEVPEGIREIGKGCFFDKRGILSITLPKSLKIINSNAFGNCINLKNISFAAAPDLIAESALSNCSSLQYVIAADQVQYPFVGIESLRDIEIPAYVRQVFQQQLSNFLIYGTSLVEYRGTESRVTIPYGIRHIAALAFKGKETIDSVLLPDTVVSIGDNAFEDCVTMQTINFPNSIKSIGKEAFLGCVKLLRAHLPAELLILESGVFNRCEKLKEVLFPPALTHIGELAFYGCKGLSALEFPQSLIAIGTMAFYKNKHLVHVSLPPMLKNLGAEAFAKSGLRSARINALCCASSHAFAFCSRLSELVFADGTEDIGDFFAWQCGNLISISIPPSIIRVGKSPFGGSIFWRSMEEGIYNHILMDGTRGKGVVKIPNEITVIAGSAFYENREISAVILPDTLESIGSAAFAGCDGLAEITLPAKVTAIEANTFAYATALKTVTSKGKICKVNAEAFYHCTALQTISLDHAVKIGASAFYGCLSLTEIRISDPVIAEFAFDKTPFFTEQVSTQNLFILGRTLMNGQAAQGVVKIPDDVVRIAPYAFCNNQLITEVMLPSQLERVGTRAFANCKKLVKVSFPAHAVELGDRAFERCSKLLEVTMSASMIKNEAFAYCTALEQVHIETVCTIGASAFRGCRCLNWVVCPEVTAIEPFAFERCCSLHTVDMKCLRQISTRAFSGCDALAGFEFSFGAQIGAYAFADCGQLETVVLSSATEFSPTAFSGCTRLYLVKLDGEEYQLYHYTQLLTGLSPALVNEIYASILECFGIDQNHMIYAYRNDGVIIDIPDGITAIGDEVFYNRPDMSEFRIPSSVKVIGQRAFAATRWLEQQKRKNTLVVANQILIDGTAAVGHIVIPETVRAVAGWAFANAYGITKVTVASHKTELAPFAFRNCIHLKAFCIEDNTYYLTGLGNLHDDWPRLIQRVFADAYNCFKTDANGTLIECTGNIPHQSIPPGIRRFGSGVFKNSNLLTEIWIDGMVSSFGADAFANCQWLHTVKGAYGVTEIGERAFYNCTVLEYLPQLLALREIGSRAFENCVSLSTIDLPEGITTIPKRAFFRCRSLRKIVLPATVKWIEPEAFAYCALLETVVFPPGLEQIGDYAFAWCPKLNAKMLPDCVDMGSDVFLGGQHEA